MATQPVSPTRHFLLKNVNLLGRLGWLGRSGERVTWSLGCEFEPHSSCWDYLKEMKKKNEKKKKTQQQCKSLASHLKLKGKTHIRKQATTTKTVVHVSPLKKTDKTGRQLLLPQPELPWFLIFFKNWFFGFLIDCWTHSMHLNSHKPKLSKNS